MKNSRLLRSFSAEAVAIWAIILGVAFGLCVTFFKHYDYTDEGLYHYLLIWGPEGTFMSPFYILFHYLGILWGHHIVGYRFLNLVMILASTFFLADSVFRFLNGLSFKISRSNFWMATGILELLALFHYNSISTLGYDSLSFVSSSLWLGAFFRVLPCSNEPREYLPSLFGLVGANFLAFTARPPYGVMLGFFTVFFLPVCSFILNRSYGMR